MLRTIRYRPLEAVVIAILAALVTACAVITPLYERGMQQAMLHGDLARMTPVAKGLTLTTSGVLPTIFHADKTSVALTPGQLAALVPTELLPTYRAPVSTTSVSVTIPGPRTRSSDGKLMWRSGACARLRFSSGTCPDGVGEIGVSKADAANFGWHPGSTIKVQENLATLVKGRRHSATLVVSGIYSDPSGDYWSGWPLTGTSGTEPDQRRLHDVWLTDESTLAPVAGHPRDIWRNPTTTLNYHLRAGVGVDSVLTAARDLAALKQRLAQRPDTVAPVRLRTALISEADALYTARRQAGIAVPLLMVPLVLLSAVVLWLVLGSATEQRRPELALARLRGRGSNGARRQLLAELLPAVVGGSLAGGLVGVGLGSLGRHVVLPAGAPFELRADFWLVLLTTLALLVLVTVTAAARVSRDPVLDLLRHVPQRTTGWRLGVADAVVLAVAGATLVALLTGSVTGPVAFAAPAVIGVAAGTLLARLLAPVSALVGHHLMNRGHADGAVAVLQAARRPTTRSLLTILTVVATLLVFAVNAVVVGARNRQYAAEQLVGAPLVAVLSGGTLPQIRTAMAAADPGGHELTPVVALSAPIGSWDGELFVVPDQFSRIAVFPLQSHAAADLAKLRPTSVQPIRLKGTTVAFALSTKRFYGNGRVQHRPVTLALRLLLPDGNLEVVPTGLIPQGTSGDHRRHVPVPCTAGCTLIGWSLQTSDNNIGAGAFTIHGLRTSSGQHDLLGKASNWRGPADTFAGTLVPSQPGPDNLTVTVGNPGSSELVLTHAWVPAVLPALVHGSLPTDSTNREFRSPSLGVGLNTLSLSGRVPRIPTQHGNALIIDLDAAARAGIPIDETRSRQVWFAHDDPIRLAALKKALATQHLRVVAEHRISEARRTYDASTPAWSLLLGLLVGGAGLLLGVLTLLVSAVTSWRTQSRDLAALRMTGVSTRRLRMIATLGLLPATVVAVLAGAGCGLLGAHFAMPTAPLFRTEPATSTLDLSMAWPVLAPVVAGLLVVLAAVGWLCAREICRRADLAQVREVQ